MPKRTTSVSEKRNASARLTQDVRIIEAPKVQLGEFDVGTGISRDEFVKESQSPEPTNPLTKRNFLVTGSNYGVPSNFGKIIGGPGEVSPGKSELNADKLQADLLAVLVRHKVSSPDRCAALARELFAKIELHSNSSPAHRGSDRAPTLSTDRLSIFVPTEKSKQDEDIKNPSVEKDDIAHLRGREPWVAGKGQNPAAFIRHVYKDVLAAKTLTRAQLLQVDPVLYKSYSNWIRPNHHPEDDLNLPTFGRRAFSSPEDELAHKRSVMRQARARYAARRKDILSPC